MTSLGATTGRARYTEGRWGLLVLTVTRPGAKPVQSEFDTKVPDELAELEKQFNQHRAEGMMAIAVSPTEKKQLQSFDPAAEEIVFHAPLVGG